jgi:4-aminobutyrate aminotransferase-like enzyme
VPHSGQIDRFVDKPIVLGKICEEYVKDIISKRDALVYIADAEMYLKYARQASMSETDLGNLRSMALRYGYASTSDGVPIRAADGKALLDMLKPAMLINMARAAPQVAGAVSTALNQMPTSAAAVTSVPTDGERRAKRART